MKIRLYFEKENLIRLAVAMVFAAVMFAVIRFPVWVLFGFGVLYFGIKSLKIELNEKMSWLWSAIMLGTGGIFTAYHIQYLLLDAELRAKISDNKMFLNVLCCLVVFLVIQIFTNNTGLTCLISHIVLLSLAGINYFVYLFRGNEFIFSDLKSIQGIMNLFWMQGRAMSYFFPRCMLHLSVNYTYPLRKGFRCRSCAFHLPCCVVYTLENIRRVL